MPEGAHAPSPLDPAKFRDPHTTAKGEIRATVALSALKTLWFNTGSLCNITCDNCYMHSSPTNDDLVYFSREHAHRYLDEIKREDMGVKEIGFTGGEPFMNPDLVDILDDVLSHGFQALVLTNAMKPLWQKRAELLTLKAKHDVKQLKLRISIDHHTPLGHEKVRGQGSWAPMETGLKWLLEHGFHIDIAGRPIWGESEEVERNAYQALFADWGLDLDAQNPSRLVLFPEMDETTDVPEITTQCWGLLDVRPDAMMCASSRMVVHRNGENLPTVMPCTLLPYDARFDMGTRLSDAQGPVALNHPHCAKFCVLGGASCSA